MKDGFSPWMVNGVGGVLFNHGSGQPCVILCAKSSLTWSVSVQYAMDNGRRDGMGVLESMMLTGM